MKTTDVVREIVKSNPGLIPALGGDESVIQETLQFIEGLDDMFISSNGSVWLYDLLDQESAPYEFYKTHIQHYRKFARPSIPSLATIFCKWLGFDLDSPQYKAMMMVALRAEMPMICNPAYHNCYHYIDVLAAAANALYVHKNYFLTGGQMLVPLSERQQVNTLIAATGHDLNHPGFGNPVGQPYLNEDAAFAALEPILKALNLTDRDLEDIQTMIRGTSPDGPHHIVQTAALKAIQPQISYWHDIDPAHHFPELELLVFDPGLAIQAGILHGADLYSSISIIQSNVTMSQALTKEVNATTDFCSAVSRQYLLDNVIGPNGFAFCPAIDAMAGKSLQQLRAFNAKLLDLSL